MVITTLNIHVDVFSKITQSAALLEKSRKEVVVLLLMRIMKDHRLFVRGFSTVKYQRDDVKKNWHCFHIRLRGDEKEYFEDLRKLSKFSVSCLLAIAVKRYLEKILSDRGKKIVDNYTHFSNYVLHHEVVDGIISFHSYWGYPEEHLKTLRL